MYEPKLGPYDSMALRIASELAKFFYFLLLGGCAREVSLAAFFPVILQHAVVARPNFPRYPLFFHVIC